MFIRKKGESYYYVENHRVNGKVRQKIVACLGRGWKLDKAIADETHWLTGMKR